MRKRTFVLFAVSIILGWFSLSASGALHTISISRNLTTVTTSTDPASILGISNFNDVSFTGLNTRNTQTNLNLGTIKNNSNKQLNLSITIDPNIVITQNPNSTWIITYNFNYLSNPTSLQTLTFSGAGQTDPLATTTNVFALLPGQTIEVKATISFQQNQFQAIISYGFIASGEGITINIQDTTIQPRRHTLSN